MHDSITEKTREILEGIPPHVEAAAAAKTRTAGEVLAAVKGGIKIIAHNYVREAGEMLPAVGKGVKWHMIGKLQKNKANKAIRIFDMIETADSLNLFEALEKRCAAEAGVMPVLVQINIAGESTKAGIAPEEAERFLEETGDFRHVPVQGLMTIEPFTSSPEEARKYFRRMRELYDELRSFHPAAGNFRYLSMGMSRTYKTAIEEGASIVRIGTGIFGERDG